ncbi:ATP-dependent RNA helicase RhlE [Pseudoalteromonas sp. MSK9-3]|uniref:DEAD/DEAH box helicase n=1 Tax=Pseudoalteromonas sp. MSK9-3 TaxID=1897633 RepID=UPI000E6CAC74|nr:DEAD/DEAH box helicase [Pseudoalteromonas sp. MSK9-3]RJE75531.1 ATP-dependent RNA helicase RhlE [Pseudoalteromonas sp. MSK9-3]
MSFSSLGLCTALLKAISEQGYTTPSRIQQKAIPAILDLNDVMAVAQTGTGKTAGFTLPVIQRLSGGSQAQANHVRALIIAPTRELAAQVAESVENYSSHINLSSAAVFGGVRIEPQIAALQTGLDILVATPGRLIDLYNQNAINFAQLEVLVLDEADRMLDLGFIEDITHIASLLPKKRQTLMFSATFSEEIKTLASGMLSNPQLVEVTAVNSTVDTIRQKVYSVDKARKSEMLVHLIKTNNWRQILVFSRTKKGADELVSQLERANIPAASIHANRTQHARTHALEGFKSDKIKVLVATDIASRGIDIDQLPCVINYDLPDIAEDYVHRIGRTGRAGTKGLAISLVSTSEAKQLLAIERMINRTFSQEVIPGFTPTKKATVAKYDDDEYGNFEADPAPRRNGKSSGRKSRSNITSSRKRRK